MRQLVLLSIFVLGCSLQSEGTSPEAELVSDSSSVIDTSSGDTNVAPDDTISVSDDTLDTTPVELDSAKPDTGVVDTSMPDTAKPDTSMPDTTMPDTAPPDTGPKDTGPVDVGPEAPPPSLSITSTSISDYTIDLAAGTRDWAHWGHTTTDAFNRKKGLALISKGTQTGALSFESLVYHFAWSNGDPLATMADTKRGLQLSSAGDSVSFDAKCDPFMESTLDLWMSATGGTTTVTATLPDATTGPAVTTIPGGVYVVTVKYRSATAAGAVKIDIKKTDSTAYSSFFAAALR